MNDLVGDRSQFLEKFVKASEYLVIPNFPFKMGASTCKMIESCQVYEFTRARESEVVLVPFVPISCSVYFMSP